MAGADLSRARELRAQGRLAEALRLLEPLTGDPGAMLELADLQHATGQFGLAASTLQRLIASDPGRPDALRLLGRVHLSAGRLDEAGGAFSRALDLDPSDGVAIAGRASALHRAGRHDEALAAIDPHLRTPEVHDAVAAIFARLAGRAGRLEEASLTLERALARPDIPRERRATALHALGDVLESLARFDGSFEAHRAANALQAVPFPAEAQERLLARVREVYAPQTDGRTPLATSGLDTEAPVFIVGMPRSGTSLAEQILASHPAVRAGGERDDIRRIIVALPAHTAPAAPFPDAARGLTAPALRSLGEGYLAPMLAPGALRITDKMPMNVMALGLIAQLFPRARVIHCTRHPLDTCVSCYFSNFAGAHPYTRDLTALGRFYGQYARMMAFWAAASPLPIFEWSYESLVADQEPRTRSLIEFLSLPWDDACLRFHESERTVHTASFDQVRRPMYTGSVGRWTRYAPHLGPLIEALRAEGVELAGV